ncbi:uncharacterized protein JN550_010069 [Neoarthrinium moseri]|uniref:uncharacterized protein n=1 Tax=Neoarthrinium moseri TaxID=1658444 RepID=UPI001FDE2B5F|nr:uncharacterized protein JN550_010069 [Neoarthrinium moseri]KAI1862732.1 hypothetical protein JN550_010069 [Neoarthrinium moseri]
MSEYPLSSGDDLLSHDRVIDPSYIKAGSTESQYSAQPWNHCENALQSYLSLRFSARQNFLDQLKGISGEGYQRTIREIRRIDEHRNKFLSYSNKQDLINSLRDAHSKWKKTVFNASELEEISRERKKRLKQLENASTRKVATNSQKALYMNHTKILRNWDAKHLESLKQTVGRYGRDSPVSNGLRPNQSASVPTQDPSGPGAEERPLQDAEEELQRASDSYYGLKAGAMYFTKGSDGTLRGIDSNNGNYRGSKFPDQKIAMETILDGADDNPLSEECPKDTIRYFHIPSNNMEWIEKAIKQHYGNQLTAPNDCTRLLAREHWLGQMHGGGTAPVHSRHMRSKCLLIPREAEPNHPTSQSSGSIPTSSNPESAHEPQSAAVSLAGNNVAIFLPYLHWEMSSRRAQMVNVVNEAISANSISSSKKLRLIHTVSDVWKKNKTSKKVVNSKNKEPPLRRMYLGQYLLALARLAEEMDYEAHERLLRDNVDKDPPLHIRRTLDQYYFLTLENTSERDKDQVVYRGTKPRDSPTRVVMVDQLWLWILNDNTIITSFPRRWGRNKPDASGVHKSLRVRLRKGTEEIRSIHHLAMIIVDQCSRVFFDRTRPLDQRPEVMDLFAEAIGTVTEKTRIAYDHFWRAIAQASHKVPMVINPEGILLKEAQDITEELMIMKRVYSEQLKVMKDFERHLSHPHGRQPTTSGYTLVPNELLFNSADQLVRDLNSVESKISNFEGQGRKESVYEARDLVELLLARRDEIQDLEEAALRACKQALLSLKQQQASIVDARAALDTAHQTYQQGRTIQAFTIVTIVFLPLSFIAAFFGMNNQEINESHWMSLWAQIKWLFGGTAVVIFISLSLAFGAWFHALSAWIKAALRLCFDVTWALLSDRTKMIRLYDWWRASLFNSNNIDRSRERLLARIDKKRRERLAWQEEAGMSLVSQRGEVDRGNQEVPDTRLPQQLNGRASGTTDNIV